MEHKEERRGGARKGAGRPAGSKNIYSNESVKKLEELGFDPITMMVQKYHEITEALTGTYMNAEGVEMPTVREGSGAYAQLVATQGILINNLMQYGYKKVPEKQEIEQTTKPMEINFSFGNATEEEETEKKK